MSRYSSFAGVCPRHWSHYKISEAEVKTGHEGTESLKTRRVIAADVSSVSSWNLVSQELPEVIAFGKHNCCPHQNTYACGSCRNVFDDTDFLVFLILHKIT